MELQRKVREMSEEEEFVRRNMEHTFVVKDKCKHFDFCHIPFFTDERRPPREHGRRKRTNEIIYGICAKIDE